MLSPRSCYRFIFISLSGVVEFFPPTHSHAFTLLSHGLKRLPKFAQHSPITLHVFSGDGPAVTGSVLCSPLSESGLYTPPGGDALPGQ